MRMMLTAHFPHEPFNSLVREGRAGELLERIVEAIKPEAIYFVELDGARAAVAVVEVPDAAAVPSFAEPFFLNFNADCEFRIAMTPEDLARAGLDALAKQWG